MPRRRCGRHCSVWPRWFSFTGRTPSEAQGAAEQMGATAGASQDPLSLRRMARTAAATGTGPRAYHDPPPEEDTPLAQERDARFEEPVHTDFAGRMNYGDYLGLDGLLAQQHPRSDSHDEMLFIIIHQAKELWLKLMLHELTAAVGHVRADRLAPAFKGLARITRIQEQMIKAWDVLSTLTPADYLRFRPALGQSSGFQSYQYRELEFMLGAKDAAMLAPHHDRPAVLARLEAVLAAPSLYDECLMLLARRGFDLPAAVLVRDWRLPYRSDPAVKAAWLQVYRATDRHWDLYELAEELVDVEDWFQQWRFRHAKTVERIIGMRTGTGGSSGVNYLRGALERYFFPELWELRTEL